MITHGVDSFMYVAPRLSCIVVGCRPVLMTKQRHSACGTFVLYCIFFFLNFKLFLLPFLQS